MFRPLVAVFTVVAIPAVAQTMPTSQPAIVDVARELEKPGHFAAHEQTEARWADLNRRHGYPATYLALVAVSGTPEVWWITPHSGLDAMGKAIAFGSGNAEYTQALGRIAMEDGDHLASSSRMQLASVPDASFGSFPEVAKIRVYAITTFTMRSGMESAFADMAKRYAALMRTGGVPVAWRAYEVVSGAPGGTYVGFASYPSWEAVEAERKASGTAMAGANAADLEALTKLSRESVVSMNTRYFTVNPRMSLVPRETMAADPFWAPKPAAPRKTPQ